MKSTASSKQAMCSCLALAVTLSVAFAGWYASIGPPFREFPEDLLQALGIVASLVLLAVVIPVLASEARAGRITPRLRATGWCVCTLGLLLPAFIAWNAYLPVAGSDAFGCGSLSGIDYPFVADPAAVARCRDIRAGQRDLVILLAGPAVLASAWLLRRLTRPRQAGSREHASGPFAGSLGHR